MRLLNICVMLIIKGKVIVIIIIIKLGRRGGTISNLKTIQIGSINNQSCSSNKGTREGKVEDKDADQT